MKLKHFVFGIFFFLLVCAGFANELSNGNFDDDIVFLEAESIVEEFFKPASLIFRANTKKVEIYLNGEYIGLTPVRIEGIADGVYTVCAEKKGFEQKVFYVQAEREKSKEFYIKIK